MREVATEELQALLDAQAGGTVRIDDDYRVCPDPGNKLILGWKHCLYLWTVTQSGLTIDGGGHRLEVVVDGTVQSDTALLAVPVNARGVHIKNWRITFVYNGEHTSRTVYAIRNQARNCKLTDLHVTMAAKSQINMTAVYNQGAIDTTLESGADELVVESCTFRMSNGAATFELPQQYYGIYNHLANSIELTGNYLFIQNRGTGAAQQTTAVYNSGRYARIANNNIKANGSHNVGKQLENCYVTGLENRGDYLLLSDNNVVGEWGGRCLGFVNYGQYVKADGNKILSTHTIHGCSIRQYGRRGIFSNNIVTSTSRNPRLVEICGDENLLQGNVIDALMRNACYSGCCVRVTGGAQPVRKVLIRGNLLAGAVDAGVQLRHCEHCVVTDNSIEGVPQRAHFTPVLLSEGDNTVCDNLLDDWLQPDEQTAADNLDDDRIVSVYE